MRHHVLAIDDVVQRDHARTPGPEDADELEVGQPGAQLLDHADVVEALEAGRADEGAALGEADDVFHFPAAEVRPDLVGHRPQALEGEEDVGELHPVRELDGHHVTRPDPERAELRRHPIHARRELRVGDATATVHERLPLRVGRRPPREDGGEGLVAPVTGAPVPSHHLVRQARVEPHTASRTPWTIAPTPDVSSLHHMGCATHPDPIPLPRRGGEGRVRGTYDVAPCVREQCGLVDPPATLAISRSRHDGTVGHATRGG